VRRAGHFLRAAAGGFLLDRFPDKPLFVWGPIAVPVFAAAVGFLFWRGYSRTEVKDKKSEIKMVKPIEIRTERLLLRPFRMSDVDDWLEITADQDWARYQINIPPVPLSRKQAEELTAMFSDTAAWEKIGLLQIFAIVLDDKVIGEIALNRREDDRPNERVEIGYSLIRRHWNQGLMTEAARAVMDWAFQNYSFNRLYALCDREIPVRGGNGKTGHEAGRPAAEPPQVERRVPRPVVLRNIKGGMEKVTAEVRPL